MGSEEHRRAVKPQIWSYMLIESDIKLRTTSRNPGDSRFSDLKAHEHIPTIRTISFTRLHDMSAVVGIARNTYLAVIGKPSKWRPGPNQTMREHKDVVREVAFFKDGRWVVTGSDDRTQRTWDIQEGGLPMVAGPLEEHTDRAIRHSFCRR